jgi:hypothetical protein
MARLIGDPIGASQGRAAIERRRTRKNYAISALILAHRVQGPPMTTEEKL